MKAVILSMVLLSSALAGCVSFGPHEPLRYYVLDVPVVTTGAAVAKSRESTLLVAPITVAGFYETQEIVYSRTPGTRAYYQRHAWSERPGPRMTELLVMRLDGAGIFKNVAKAGTGVRGDVVLNMHLTEFYHDATTVPGSVKVMMTAELTDPARRTFLARRTFTRTGSVTTYDAPGAVQAFNSTVATLLEEMTAWVDTAAPR